MNKFSPRNKIFLYTAVLLIASVIMFMYVFEITNTSNKKILGTISDQKRELNVLSAERESYKQAELDLDTLAKKPIQPSSFFSKDVTLVREIEILQNLGEQTGLVLTLSGISGTTKTAPKAKTVGDIVVIPYNISLSGPFPQVVDFIQTLENLDFITNVSSVAISAATNSSVNASLSATFYLQK